MTTEIIFSPNFPNDRLIYYDPYYNQNFLIFCVLVIYNMLGEIQHRLLLYC